ALHVSEGWRALASADGQRITLLGKEVGEAVQYGKLVIWDANGSPVNGALLVEEERVIIEVDDSNAAYPLTIDPTFALQQKFTSADGAANDLFGVSVAISAETAVVGASFDKIGANTIQGSAYVFVRYGATWAQQAKLTASDGATNDQFGTRVTISGDTIVVGAYLDDVNFPDQGSAYVFVRSGTTWAQQQKLIRSTGTAGDNFGASVAISGDTVVIGVPNAPGGYEGMYIFTRSGATWANSYTLVGGGVSNLGTSVAISGNTAVGGAPRVNGYEGLAYVSTRNGTNWTTQTLTASDGAANDAFGSSVAVSGETVVVGAEGDDNNRGAAYVFTRNGTTWTEQKLTATDGAAGDRFGVSVAISGDTAVIGAHADDVNFADQGSAYVFVRSGTEWAFQQKLAATDGAASALFGYSVAISGETVVVGANGDDVGANGSQRSAYVYVPCRYDLTPNTQNFSSAGGSGSFTVNCAANCAWMAAALPAWLTITSSASGTGNGTITFTVAANSGLPRTSSISVSGSSFVVTQDGSCALTINPSGLPGGITNTAYNQTLTASGGNGSYNWQLVNATTLPPGLSLSAGGVIAGTPTAGSQGNYTFTVAAVDTNGCVGSRTYTMNIATCAVTSLTPTSQSAGSAGGSFNFTVTAPGCAWTTLSHASWLTVTVNPTGTGNLVVGYSVAANPGAARTGVITVNNQVFTVTQGIAATNNGLQFYPLAAPVRLLDTRGNGVSPNACTVNG
ncbi:MAG: putative Ig domain-containing protein, partial [Acidobacteriota bacterium]|nr:putative Ig domain-containing protein [Acidobacteriota bacterium]